MAYLARADGTHFIIPSYRDVLTVKNTNAIRSEVLTLSQRYGEYISLQKKNRFQYELACSSDVGYLLGESIWHTLKKPENLIYCEADDNGVDAILVIVKSGSVYLDGRFPIDSLFDELVLIQTEQLKFDVVIYGNVPISTKPQDGFFSLSEAQLSSFRQLDKPVFSTMPLYKIYYLQLVEPVLKAQGIGVFPVAPVIWSIVVLGLCWMGWMYFSQGKVTVTVAPVSPYQGYLDALHTPNLSTVIQAMQSQSNLFVSMPGWIAQSMSYSNQSLKVKVISFGGSMTDLISWARKNNLPLTVSAKDIGFNLPLKLSLRPDYLKIYPLDEVIAKVVDTFGFIEKKNLVQLSEVTKKGPYSVVKATVQLDDANQSILLFIGRSLQNLPVEITSIDWQLQESNTVISCTLQFNIFGN